MSETQAMAYDVFASRCPSRGMFERVTGKWGALVLGRLTRTPQRFCEIREQIDGISDRMLTQTLRRLCDDQLVERIVVGEAAGHPVYQLTAVGDDVASAVRNLITSVEIAMTRGAGA